MRSVTPLPAALSGNITQRLIEIDEALIPYVSGALVWLCDKEPFEETGALTVDEAKELFSDMLQTYFEDFPVIVPVGATMTWHTAVAPERWIVCEGGVVYVADYPELFALWGYKYGASGAQFGIIDMRDVSPMGAGGTVSLDGNSGATTHVLTYSQMPIHNHRVPRASATVDVTVSTVTANLRTDSGTAPDILTGVSGGGQAHNNLHPVKGVKWIVYGGKAP